jgi:hypothetical protein
MDGSGQFVELETGVEEQKIGDAWVELQRSNDGLIPEAVVHQIV